MNREFAECETCGLVAEGENGITVSGHLVRGIAKQHAVQAQHNVRLTRTTVERFDYARPARDASA